jgi:transcription elongation factor Elf1
MGRRRRKKVVKLVRRKLPKVFTCPKCGGQSIKVTIDAVNKVANIICSLCGLKGELPVTPSTEAVDVYCQFTDKFYAEAIR